MAQNVTVPLIVLIMEAIMSIASLVSKVERLSRRYAPVSYGCGDHDDIRQEGVVGLLQASTRFESSKGCSLSTYGVTRAYGAMRDHVRTLARWGRESSSSDQPDGVREEVTPFQCETSVESRVQVLRFAKFLRSQWPNLSPLERDVLQMRFFDGVTIRELASALHVSPATALRMERRILERLKKTFSKNFT